MQLVCPPLRVAGPVQGLTKNLGLDIGHVGRCTKTLCTAQSTDIVQCAHKVHVFCGTLVVYAFVAEIQWKDNNQYRIPYFVTW